MNIISRFIELFMRAIGWLRRALKGRETVEAVMVFELCKHILIPELQRCLWFIWRVSFCMRESVCVCPQAVIRNVAHGRQSLDSNLKLCWNVVKQGIYNHKMLFIVHIHAHSPYMCTIPYVHLIKTNDDVIWVSSIPAQTSARQYKGLWQCLAHKDTCVQREWGPGKNALLNETS